MDPWAFILKLVRNINSENAFKTHFINEFLKIKSGSIWLLIFWNLIGKRWVGKINKFVAFKLLVFRILLKTHSISNCNSAIIQLSKLKFHKHSTIVITKCCNAFGVRRFVYTGKFLVYSKNWKKYCPWTTV